MRGDFSSVALCVMRVLQSERSDQNISSTVQQSKQRKTQSSDGHSIACHSHGHSLGVRFLLRGRKRRPSAVCTNVLEMSTRAQNVDIGIAVQSYFVVPLSDVSATRKVTAENMMPMSGVACGANISFHWPSVAEGENETRRTMLAMISTPRLPLWSTIVYARRYAALITTPSSQSSSR